VADSRVARQSIRELQAEVDNLVLSISTGGAVDYVTYRDTTGYIRGLRAAIDLIEKIDQGVE
jgi:phosphopantetheine adenylyltransferase